MSDAKEQKELLITKVPFGSCPCCGNKQFIVLESVLSAYITGIDGEILDHDEIKYNAKGKCNRCGKEYDMLSTLTGFIPMTDLRKVLWRPTNFDSTEDFKYIENPMEANNED